MPLYKITILDKVFGSLTGEFEATNNEQEAINECKELYAYELGTNEEEIKILEVKKIR